MTIKAQAHDYGSMPFGAHDAPGSKPKGKAKSEEDETMKAREVAVLRLQRPEIGATPAQAEAVVDELGVESIASASDEELAGRFAESSVAAYNPRKFNIKAVLEYVGDDPDRALAVLAAEREGEARKSLISALEELSAPGNQSDLGRDAGASGAEIGPVVEGEGDSGDDDADAGVSS